MITQMMQICCSSICSFSDDEFADVEALDDVLHIHCLMLNVISLAPRGKFSLTAAEKPLFYQLIPERPGEPARILRMTFHGEDIVLEENNDADIS